MNLRLAALGIVSMLFVATGSIGAAPTKPTKGGTTAPPSAKAYGGNFYGLGTPLLAPLGKDVVMLFPSHLGSILVQVAPDGSVVHSRNAGRGYPAALATGSDGLVVYAFNWQMREAAPESGTSERYGEIVFLRDAFVERVVRLRCPECGSLELNDLLVTADGDVVAVGRASEMLSIVVRLDSKGSLKWSKTFDFAGDEELRRVVEVNDGLVAAGSALDSPMLLKLSHDGSPVWHRVFQCFAGVADGLASARNGRIAMVGHTAEQESDVYLIDVDRKGDDAHAWTIGTDYDERGLDLRLAPDGSWLVTASMKREPDPHAKLWMFAMDRKGNITWDYLREGTEFELKQGPRRASAIVTADGRWLVATAPETNGNRAWLATVPAGAKPADWLAGLAVEGELVPPRVTSPSLEAPKIELVVTDSPTFKLKDVDLAAVETDPRPAPRSTAHPGKTAPAGCAAEAAALQKETLEAFVARDFAKLDRMAKTFRSNHENLSCGEQKLYSFYESFEFAFRSSAPLSRDEAFKRFEAWTKLRPDSITARVAYASALIDAASGARGSSFSSGVTEGAWMDVSSLLRKAASELDSYAGQVDDPHFHLNRLSIEGFTGGDIWEPFVAGTALDPHYYYLYNLAALYSVEKWGGSPEQSHAVADRGVELTRDRLGTAIVARVAFVTWLNTRDEFHRYGFDWPSIQRAFQDWSRAYPNSDRWTHNFAMLATQFRDRRVARRELQRPGVSWATAISTQWTRGWFDRANAWGLDTSHADWIDPPLQDGDVSNLVAPRVRSTAHPDAWIEDAIESLNRWLLPDAERWPLVVTPATATSRDGKLIALNIVHLDMLGRVRELTELPEGTDAASLDWGFPVERWHQNPSRAETGGPNGIVVLETSLRPSQPLCPAEKTPEYRDKVYIAHMDAAGQEQVVHIGHVLRVIGFSTFPSACSAVLGSTDGCPTCNGAAVLNEDGEFLGIVHATKRDDQGIDVVTWDSYSTAFAPWYWE